MRGMLSVRSQVFGGRAEVGGPEAHAANRNTIEIIKTALDLLKFFICASNVNPFNCMGLPILLPHKSAHRETSWKGSKEVGVLSASPRNNNEKIFRLEGNGYRGLWRDWAEPLDQEV